MYKDVAKRIIASILTFTMIGTTPDWTVLATQTGNDTSVSVETEAAIDAVMPEETEQIVEAETESVSVDAIGEEAIEASTEEAAAEEIAPEETVTEESAPEDTPIEMVVIEENTVDTEVVEAEGNLIDIGQCDVELSSTQATYSGKKQTPAITVTYNGTVVSAEHYDVKYYQSDMQTEDEMIDAGAKYIVIEGDSENTTGSKEVEQIFSIVAKNLTEAMIVGTIPNQLESCVTEGIEGLKMVDAEIDAETELKNDFDYNVSVTIPDANVNRAKVVIKGKGNYKNTIVIDTDAEDPVVIGENIADYEAIPNPCTYNGGKELTPTITLKKGLFSNTNFEYLEWENNINAGEATVVLIGTGDGEDALAGTKEVTFNIDKKDVSSGLDAIYPKKVIYQKTSDGAGVVPSVFELSHNGTKMMKGEMIEGEVSKGDYSVAFSDNTDVTTNAVITVTGGGTNYTGTATWNYEIVVADISGLDYSTEEFNTVYTGNVYEPELIIKQNDVELKEEDYTISYLDEDKNPVSEMKDAGKYWVVITGINNYADSEKKLPVVIEPKTIEGATVNLAYSEAEYNGEKFEPEVTSVKLADGTELDSTEYTVAYENNINAGKATVTVEGTGNYKGVASTSFAIWKNIADLKDTIQVGSITYNGKVEPPSVTVMDGWKTVARTNYLVNCSYDLTAGEGTVTIRGISDYYKGQCDKIFKIYPGDIEGVEIKIVEGEDLTFTGSSVEPQLVVTYGNTELSSVSDYNVTYENAVDVVNSPAKAIITGKTGAFGGSKEFEYFLKAKSLESSSIEYQGGEIDGLAFKAGNLPDFVVADTARASSELGGGAVEEGKGEYKLVEGKDYIVVGEPVLSDSGDSGTIEIEGMRNYTGTMSIEFTINQIELEPDELRAVLSKKSYAYTGSTIIPMVTVVKNVDGEETTLIQGTDFYVTVDNAIDVGDDYRYKVVCKGAYAGTFISTDTFSIIARDLSDAEVVVDPIPNQAYTGQEIEPEVTVRIGDVELDAAEYKVSYADNIEISDAAKVTITPNSTNLTGEKTATFSICENIDDIHLKGYDPECMYAGPGGTTQFVTVWKGDTQLDGSKDYSIEFINHYNATVGPDGNSNGNGPAIIRVLGKGTYGGVKDFTYEITPRPIYKKWVQNPVLADGMKVEVESVRFTGGVPEPNVKITYTNEAGVEYVLQEDVDYIIGAFSSNHVGDNTTLDISALGNFRMFGDSLNPLKYSTTILPKKFANADGTLAENIIVECPTEVEFEEGVNEYTPEIKVYDASRSSSDGTPQAPNENDCYQLKSTEYEVRYNNNQKPGTATFTITGRGDYADGVYTKGSFNIVADLGGVQVDMLKDYVYTGKPVKVEIKKVSVPGAELAYNTDYTYEVGPYAPTGDSELTDVGEYYVRIIGKGAYADSEPQQFLFNIVPKTIEDTATVKMSNVYGSYSYTGKPIEPDPWFEYNGIEMERNVDFEVIYDDNAGVAGETYTLTVNGINNFTGTITKTYVVGDNFDVTIELDPDPGEKGFEFTGEAYRPKVTVWDNKIQGKKLELGEDYEMQYAKNLEAGTAYVNVWGLPNPNNPLDGYCGNAQKTFIINPKSLDDAAIEIAAVEQVTYNREEHTPTTTVFWNKGDGNKVELHEGTDFEYSYENNIDASTADAKAKLCINGIGNYKDSKSIEFVINKKNITEEDVTVEEIANQVYSGTEVDPVPEVIWEDIPLVEGTEFKLTYENNTELTTDDSKAKMTIEGTGNYEGTIEKEFNIVPIPVRDMVFEYKADWLYTGKEITPKVTMYYQYPTGNYASDKYPAGDKVWQDEKNFTVEYKHTKEAGEKDSSIINITAIEEHYSGSTQCYYTIGRRPLSDGTITMDKIPNQVANKELGEAAKPMPTLTFRPDSTTTYTLIYGADYTVKWENNTEPGMTGTIIVEGKGNFTDEKVETFYIGMDIHQYIKGEVKFGEVVDYIYNGKAQTPEVVVEDTTLVPNVNYEILYDGVKADEIVDDSHATKAGIHKAAVVGINEYGGIIELEYEIDKRDISKVEFRTPEGTAYTGSPVYPLIVGHDEAAITRLGEDESTAETTGDISMEGMWTNLNAFTTSYQGNHTDIGPVTVTITATEDANYYGTTTLQFNIEPKDLQSEDILSSTVENQTYTGSPIKPEMKITDGGRNVNGTAFIAGTDIDYYTLVEGLDYDITFTDNIYPGRVTMTITGKNHYKGTLAKQFDIGADLSSAVIAPIPPQTYTGQPICPELKVTIGEKELKANFDYTATYANNVERGTATVTISPVAGSMFTGSNTATFEIGRELSEATTEIKLVSDSFVYTGNAIMPKPAVIYAGTKLVEGVDYTLSYSNNINVGTATITITAAGTFEGAVAKTFTIARRSITRCAFENVYDLLYNGNATTQNVVVKDGNRTLVENKDYTVTYANNVGPGAASVILTGIGNYAAVKTVYYMINVRPMGKIKGKATSNKVIKISWEPVAGAQGYAIYNAKNDLIGKTTKTYFNHKKLKALKNYKYKVRPYCVNDGTTYYGAFSNTITVRTLAKAPTKVKVKAGDDQLTISWKKVKGVSGYVVYRSTKKSGKYKKVATLKKASKTSWTNTNLASGKRYYYKVRSYKTIKGKKIYSKYTSPKSAKTY